MLMSLQVFGVSLRDLLPGLLLQSFDVLNNTNQYRKITHCKARTLKFYDLIWLVINCCSCKTSSSFCDGLLCNCYDYMLFSFWWLLDMESIIISINLNPCHHLSSQNENSKVGEPFGSKICSINC